MKTKLIKLKDKFILVSDEEIKESDLCLDINSNHIFECWKNRPNDGIYEWKNNLSWVRLHKNCKEVIAGIPELPSIDFSLLSEEDCKTIGFVDIEKLATRKYGTHIYAIEEPDAHGYIQSLQQTSWDVEIEMETSLQIKNRQKVGDFICSKIIKDTIFPQPKITNNSIRIVKIL